MADAQPKRLDFFKKSTEAMQNQGVIISETPFEVLCDLSAGKFKDASSNSLGEEMSMFVLKFGRTWGIPPWNKDEDAKPEFFGELWFNAVDGKLGKEAGRLVCKMLKPLRQLRFFEQQATKLMGGGYDYREVVWVPKFEEKGGVDKEGKATKYYTIKWDYRFPQGKEEENKLMAIAGILEADPELSQCRDDSTGLLYLEDLSTDQRKQLVASMQTVKLDLPQLAGAMVDEMKHRALPQSQSDPETEPKYVSGLLTDDF